ncbi:MAG: helicase-related protein [Sphingopyxis sp.]|nr:helicase-related protein [Sphingopyxis sp.]
MGKAMATRSSPVRAVLGPTNTGKTHLAVERLCAHSSGMVGFPLRLLAREVYDRVVKLKGEKQVALVTGEERILPPDARYLLGTIEALPVERDVAFVAVDEVQMGADPERGHMFTDRLLRARGREETLLLGSASATDVVRALVPDAEITARPRFSTLSFAGHSKLSRLPKRSAIVAFSAEEVYAIAEMLRRFAGGAAVVMGALSPRTRNAQVAMFEAGEVDYLVATDAIGMGLNLNVTHVAFASLSKFDGRRHRRLHLSEMAQIAGRAGRHQQDGSFGTIGQPQGGFTPEEVEGLEAHRFAPLPSLYWRNHDPDFTSLNDLVASLEVLPDQPMLRAAPQAVDLAVLKHLAGDADVSAAARNADGMRRLWDVCGLPDFEQLGAEHHSRTVLKLWQWRMQGNGQIDRDWFAARLARHSSTDGDIGALAARIAAVRTLCFIAQRGDWIADAAGWAEATAEQEARLSDALHAALAQRFVDRRLALLLRDAGRRGGELPVAIGPEGTVAVDGEPIGTLEGFQFRVDPAARAGDHKLLLAAAERHLHAELARRMQALAACEDGALALVGARGEAPMLAWQGQRVARLARGPSLTRPLVQLEPALKRLDPALGQAVRDRLAAYVASNLGKHAAPLIAMADASGDLFTPPAVRALLAALTDGGGQASRHLVDAALGALTPDDRKTLRTYGLLIGSLDLYHPQLLKPEAVRWRAALLAAWRGQMLPALPPAGAVQVASGDPHGLRIAGFRAVGDGWLRADMVERLARQAHAARLQAEAPVSALPAPVDADTAEVGAEPEPLPGFAIDPALATSLGLNDTARRQLLSALGFRTAGDPAAERWRWTGKVRRAKVREARPQRVPATAAPARHANQREAKPAQRLTPTAKAAPPPRPPQRGVNSPFAGLAELMAAARKP